MIATITKISDIFRISKVQNVFDAQCRYWLPLDIQMLGVLIFNSVKICYIMWELNLL